jgi:hypothetical protein
MRYGVSHQNTSTYSCVYFFMRKGLGCQSVKTHDPNCQFFMERLDEIRTEINFIYGYYREKNTTRVFFLSMRPDTLFLVIQLVMNAHCTSAKITSPIQFCNLMSGDNDFYCYIFPDKKLQ